jgi:hypothetical protein
VLKQEPETIAAGEGKVVKIISGWHLPGTHQYRVVFMIRPLEEVVASQNRMATHGKDIPHADRHVMQPSKAFKEVDGWLANKPYLRVLRVNHADVVARPREAAVELRSSSGALIDRQDGGASGTVIYRERAGSMSSAALRNLLNQLNCGKAVRERVVSSEREDAASGPPFAGVTLMCRRRAIAQST